MASNKTILEGQFTLWKVINVAADRVFTTAIEFRTAYLKGLTDNYDNISIRCLFRNNTTNNRAAIDYCYAQFNDNDVSTTAEGGHRVGSIFYGEYGANVFAGSQIYIYYAVLDTEI